MFTKFLKNVESKTKQQRIQMNLRAFPLNVSSSHFFQIILKE